VFTGLSNRGYAGFLQGIARHETLDFRKPFQLLRAVRRTDFDLFIDSDSWPRVSAMITAITRSRFTVGFECPGQSRHYAYDVQVPHSNEIHELENYRNLLRAIRISRGRLCVSFLAWRKKKSPEGVVLWRLADARHETPRTAWRKHHSHGRAFRPRQERGLPSLVAG
jgi:ADP-heptose:LPS heptosyltransferase